MYSIYYIVSGRSAFAVCESAKTNLYGLSTIYMLTMPRTNETNQNAKPTVFIPPILRTKRVQHLSLITIYLADDCRSLYWLTMLTY